MLTLITGVPGAGKTSNTLWDFVNSPTTRPRFVTPITGFDPIKHGLGELDSLEHWQDLPDGSQVLVDEAQQFLRPRSSRQVPAWLAGFETHRHRGIDITLITQHPGLIDSHVRKLVGKHIHYHRPFGLKNATRYVWEIVQENPHLPAARKAGEAVRVKPNPKVFSLYTSTVLDTHKAQLPWKWISTAAIGLCVLLLGVSYFFNFISSKQKTAEAAKSVPVVAQVAAPGQAPSPDYGLGNRQFAASDLSPRIQGMQWTAPFYDGLTQPTDFPRISACIASNRPSCNCFTQQATPIEVPASVCYRIVENGAFDPWQTGRRNQVSVGPQERVPQPAPQQLAQSQVLVLPEPQASDVSNRQPQSLYPD